MIVNMRLKPAQLQPELERFFALSAKKIQRLAKSWDRSKGTPVFTQRGRYITRGWTEWTQGFMYGCQLLQFDATGETAFLEMGRKNTVEEMAPHISHIGVHDHGFNNVSTYGTLWRLMQEERIALNEDALAHYALALKVSGAVQAARWSCIADGSGYIHSFNGPHSLFSDTIRSCRALVLADRLGHVLMGENDAVISLLARAIKHIRNTLRFNVYYGKKRDAYDIAGRVVHESIFNMTDGNYRCPSTQQGYSPFTTWTRGLAWVLLGCAEELECFRSIPEEHWRGLDTQGDIVQEMLTAAKATADFYLQYTTTDGIPYWDTGAPGLAHIPEPYTQASDPQNPYEPMDSSAAAIAAQGLLRLGDYLGKTQKGKRYYQAGLTVARTLLSSPYLSEDPKHQGLILHSIYHRPNNWDYIPKGAKTPYGESSMWGDYHAMELATYLQREIRGDENLYFFGPKTLAHKTNPRW